MINKFYILYDERDGYLLSNKFAFKWNWPFGYSTPQFNLKPNIKQMEIYCENNVLFVDSEYQVELLLTKTKRIEDCSVFI